MVAHVFCGFSGTLSSPERPHDLKGTVRAVSCPSAKRLYGTGDWSVSLHDRLTAGGTACSSELSNIVDTSDVGDPIVADAAIEY